jgi:restriction system protein
MAIPDYQSLMLPVLELAADGAEHRISDVVESLAQHRKLSDSEREELLPSGKLPVFNNRVHRAKTYLAQAKLLVSTRRAFFRITEKSLGQLEFFHRFIEASFRALAENAS